MLVSGLLGIECGVVGAALSGVHITGLPVVDDFMTLVGIVSEKDMLKLLFDPKVKPRKTGEFMNFFKFTFLKALFEKLAISLKKVSNNSNLLILLRTCGSYCLERKRLKRSI